MRVLFAYSGITFVLCIVWGISHLLDGILQTSVIFFAVAGIIVGIIAKLWRDKNLTAASHAIMFFATSTTIYACFVTGGLRLTNVTVFFMPLVASIFLLGRQGIGYAVVTVLVALGLQIAHWSGYAFPDSIPPEGREMDAFITWFVSMSIVLLFVLSYERARRLSIRKLEQANQAKTQFLANMSHEIRTPLHVIMGLNTMLEKSGLTPDQREHVRTSRQNAEVLLALLNDVLDMSKIEHGSFTQVDGSLSRRHEGAGLGLFISSEIVRLMGGRIHLESAPGEGSTFSVEIPFSTPSNGTKSSQDRSS